MFHQPRRSERRIQRTGSALDEAKQAAREAVAEYQSINDYTVGRAVEAAAPLLVRGHEVHLERCLELIAELAATAPDWLTTESDALVVPNEAKLVALDLLGRRAS
jgi:hypothetical protein